MCECVSDTATGDKMGRGRDLTDAERAFVKYTIASEAIREKV